jgi:hypothetical protein
MLHQEIQAQHRRHGMSPSLLHPLPNNLPGPVIRVSPNELSFASLSSWKTIYGHQPSGSPLPTKTEFYDIYGSAHGEGCIGSERDPQRHTRMKRLLAGGFSTRALAEQEPNISGCVDGFVEKIGNVSGAREDGVNMVKWYEMVAFDILGEMSFGESFGAVDAGTLNTPTASTLGEKINANWIP